MCPPTDASEVVCELNVVATPDLESSLSRPIRFASNLRLVRSFGLMLVIGLAVGQAGPRAAERGESPPIRTADTNDWMDSVRSGHFFGNSSSTTSRATPRPERSERAAHRSPASYSGGSSLGLGGARAFGYRSRERDLDGETRSGTEGAMSGGGTYRTVCVRLCDGYYWPVSFATTKDRFGRDQQVCERKCSAPSKLYYYPNPGGEPEVMTDLNGEPYSKLTTAFLYRTEYKEDCKCNPQPWEPEALERHRIYALEARKQKGDQKAAAELAQLKQLEVPAPSRGRRGKGKGKVESAKLESVSSPLAQPPDNGTAPQVPQPRTVRPAD